MSQNPTKIATGRIVRVQQREIVHELEGPFTDPNDLSFQYIVTTTSEPPAHLANSKRPYVVETLDATSNEGRLMRRRF